MRCVQLLPFQHGFHGIVRFPARFLSKSLGALRPDVSASYRRLPRLFQMLKHCSMDLGDTHRPPTTLLLENRSFFRWLPLVKLLQDIPQRIQRRFPRALPVHGAATLSGRLVCKAPSPAKSSQMGLQGQKSFPAPTDRIAPGSLSRGRPHTPTGTAFFSFFNASLIWTYST